MKTLPLEASDQEILDAVREWVGLLIEERYTDAYEFLYHKEGSYYWTAEMIATAIHYYGSLEPLEGGEICKVTPSEEAVVDPPTYMPLRQDVQRYRDYDPDASLWRLENGKRTKLFLRDLPMAKENPGGYVWFDLALNGYASDLTATLDFRVVNNLFVFELNDIRVM